MPTRERHNRPLVGLAPDQQIKTWQRVVERAPGGKVTGRHVEETVRAMYGNDDNNVPSSSSKSEAGAFLQAWSQQPVSEESSDGSGPANGETRMSQPLQVFMSSGDNEWYTPPEYINLARQVLGDIDLDPASSDLAQQTVQARRFFTQTSNGLAQRWHGRVWLNPPFDESSIWSDALTLRYEAGQVNEAILLVKVAFGYQWFNNLWASYPICIAWERISFIRSDGSVIGPHKIGSAFFYFGPNVSRFKHVFSQVGRVIEPE